MDRALLDALRPRVAHLVEVGYNATPNAPPDEVLPATCADCQRTLSLWRADHQLAEQVATVLERAQPIPTLCGWCARQRARLTSTAQPLVMLGPNRLVTAVSTPGPL